MKLEYVWLIVDLVFALIVVYFIDSVLSPESPWRYFLFLIPAFAVVIWIILPYPAGLKRKKIAAKIEGNNTDLSSEARNKIKLELEKLYEIKEAKKNEILKEKQEQIDKWKQFRDIGKQFYYAGIEMYVDYIGDDGLFESTFMIGVYRGNDGSIFREKFSFSKLPALIEQNRHCE